MRTSLLAGLLSTGTSAVGTWTFNSTITLEPVGTHYSVDFTSDGSSYSALYFEEYYSLPALLYLTTSSNYTLVYIENTWQKWAQRSIAITGGTDATNATLIAWLEANATRQA